MKRRSTSQDLTWFIDMRDNYQLDLSPPYQRRSVWTRKDRVYFLDTIFNGYPCPAVFLHKTTDDKGKSTYHVVDGKQRIETILLYFDNHLSMPKDHHDANLAGKNFKKLDKEYKQRFWDYVVAVDMLDIIEQAVVDEVFDRLNRNSRKLERQELRHAKYDGWLISFAEKQSELASWRDLGIATTSRAKRMKDVQFITEIVISSILGSPQGFSQDDMDSYCAEYDCPSEEMPDFDEEVFEQQFVECTDYLLAMNAHNKCVVTYAKRFMHFYSLWNVVIALRDRLSAEALAEGYTSFMQAYLELDKDTIVDESDNPHMNYAANSVGANTELPQRLARFEALQGCLNDESC